MKKARPSNQVRETTEVYRAGKPSALVDTRVVYCGDCLDEQTARKLA